MGLGILLGSSALLADDDLLIPGESLDPLAVPLPRGIAGDGLGDEFECLIVDLERVTTTEGDATSAGLTVGRGLVVPLIHELRVAAPDVDLDVEEGLVRLEGSTEASYDWLSWQPIQGPLVRITSKLLPQLGSRAAAQTVNPVGIDCNLDAPLLASLGPVSVGFDVLHATWRDHEPLAATAPLQMTRWTLTPEIGTHRLEVGDGWCVDLTGRFTLEARPGELALGSGLDLGDVVPSPSVAVRPRIELGLNAAPESDWQRRTSLRVGTKVSDDLTRSRFDLDLEYQADDLLSSPSRRPTQRIMLRLCL